MFAMLYIITTEGSESNGLTSQDGFPTERFRKQYAAKWRSEHQKESFSWNAKRDCRDMDEFEGLAKRTLPKLFSEAERGTLRI